MGRNITIEPRDHHLYDVTVAAAAAAAAASSSELNHDGRDDDEVDPNIALYAEDPDLSSNFEKMGTPKLIHSTLKEHVEGKLAHLGCNSKQLAENIMQRLDKGVKKSTIVDSIYTEMKMGSGKLLSKTAIGVVLDWIIGRSRWLKSEPVAYWPMPTAA